MNLNEMLLKRGAQISTFCPDYSGSDKEEGPCWDGGGGGGEGKNSSAVLGGGKRYRSSRIVSLILLEVRILPDQYSATASLFLGVTYYCRRNARAAPQLEPRSGRGQSIAETYDVHNGKQ